MHPEYYLIHVTKISTEVMFNIKFFIDYSDCAPKTPAPQGQDDEAAKKLWDLSASMVGLTKSQ